MAERISRAGQGKGWRIVGASLAGALLLLPLVAMRTGADVHWDARDFLLFAAMLLVAGGAIEIGVRAARDRWSGAGIGVAVVTGFLLVWVNLAVGFLGDEGNPANLLFAGVLATASVGALLVRLRPAGMAQVMTATAGAQLAVGVLALASGWASPGWDGVREVALGTTLFGGLWLLAALLFRVGARRPV